MHVLKFLLAFVFSFSFLYAENDQVEELKEYRRQKDLNAQLIKKMETFRNEGGVSENFAPPHAEENYFQQSFSPKDLLDKRFIQFLQKRLINNPFKKIPDDELKKDILNRFDRQDVRDFISQRPWILSLLVDLLKDDKALKSALGILVKKKEFRDYFFIWLCLMVAAWAFKKYFINKNWNLLIRLPLSLLVSFFFSILSLISFYIVFRENLQPTMQVMRTYL